MFYLNYNGGLPFLCSENIVLSISAVYWPGDIQRADQHDNSNVLMKLNMLWSGLYLVLSIRISNIYIIKDFRGVFERERVSRDDFFLLNKSDLKEMGLPLGVRRRILNYTQHWKWRLAKKNLRIVWVYSKLFKFDNETMCQCALLKEMK